MRNRTPRPSGPDAWRDSPPDGAEPEAPLALVREERGRLLLAAVNPAAGDAGLAPGLPLADARAILPSLATAEADSAADRKALERLAAWCGRYTPWSAADAGGGFEAGGFEAGGAAGLLLDVTGCAHLFGGEEPLLSDLIARLGRLGFAATAGLADTPGAAWAMARFAATPGRRGVAVPEGGQRAALLPLPPAALRLSAERLELLDRFGLTRIGDLLAVPPAALTPRFGDQVTRRLAQALGAALGGEDEPISPELAAPPLLVRRVFAEPVLGAEAIAGGIERLAAGLCGRLEAAQQGARRLELTLYRVDGTLARCALGTSRPSRDPAHLARLFAGKIEHIDPGFGIEVMTLAAARSEPLSALQLSLRDAAPASAPASASGPSPAPTAPPRAPAAKAAEPGLAACLDRLAGKLGEANVLALAPRESHLPERAAQAVPPLAAPGSIVGSIAGTGPGAWALPGAMPRAAPEASPAPSRAPRPLRLLDPPEPVEALALLPDHPPAQFRWRRLRHRVARAEGPERIAPEWWRPEADTRRGGPGGRPAERDYFCVEDTDGRRYWLYRAANRWYLHGLFG